MNTGFEIFYAILKWFWSGCEGSIDDYFDKQNQSPKAWLGLLYFIIFVLVLITIVRMSMSLFQLLIDKL